jgi:hypothetical protein
MAIQPEFLLVQRDLAKVQALCLRLANPHWMPRPQSWMWLRGDGMPQGFGTLAHERPGLANLLWLSLDLDAPPRTYEAHMNSLYVLLFQEAEFTFIGGTSLVDIAGLSTLREFIDRLPIEPGKRGLERMFPLLRLLAERRLPC